MTTVSVLASVGFCEFVKTMRDHYLKLPSIRSMDQWLMNGGINFIRAESAQIIMDSWRVSFCPLQDWIKDDKEIIPLSLSGAKGEQHDKVKSHMMEAGVSEDDVNKVVLLALLDRMCHDEEGKIDPAFVMPSLYDAMHEKARICIMSVTLEDDGINPVPITEKTAQELRDFGSKEHYVKALFKGARFETMLCPIPKQK